LKKIIFISLCLFLIFCLFVFKYNHDLLLKSIKNNFNTYSILKKGSYLYDKNERIIGKTYSNINIILNKKETDFKSKFYKVLDTSYYVKYNDCTKGKKQIDNHNYLLFNKNVVTDKKTVFYKDNKKNFELNSKINMPIYYMDSDYYYVKFLDDIYGIKKVDSKEVENNNTSEQSSEALAIYYGDVDKNLVDETIKYLNENNYTFIDEKEYLNYKDGFIRLKNKAVCVFDKKIDDIIDVSMISNIDDFYEIMKSDDHKLKPKYTDIAQEIAVLNYHFFYNDETKNKCQQSICISEKKFRSHLEYLKNNNFKTLKMSEFNDWMDGKIVLPKKSVLITIDDGGMGVDTIAQKLLKEYNMNATLFLITIWGTRDLYTYENLEVHSHTHDMHTNGVCPQGQGGGIRCLDEQTVMNDLKQSREYLKNPISMAYPFYEYNEFAINCVKNAGFSLAFVGGYKKANRSSFKYAIPRYPIQENITIEKFSNFVN